MCGDDDGNVFVWDPAAGCLVDSLPPLNGMVRVSAAAGAIATTAGNKEAVVWPFPAPPGDRHILHKLIWDL